MEASGLSQIAVASIVSMVMVVLFGILSVILDHHWSRYEIDPNRRRKTRKIYYSGAGIILILMLTTFVLLLV